MPITNTATKLIVTQDEVKLVADNFSLPFDTVKLVPPTIDISSSKYNNPLSFLHDFKNEEYYFEIGSDNKVIFINGVAYSDIKGYFWVDENNNVVLISIFAATKVLDESDKPKELNITKKAIERVRSTLKKDFEQALLDNIKMIEQELVRIAKQNFIAAADAEIQRLEKLKQQVNSHA